MGVTLRVVLDAESKVEDRIVETAARQVDRGCGDVSTCEDEVFSSQGASEFFASGVRCIAEGMCRGCMDIW